ncbi:hypothetical protein MNBD_BACTEROID03-2267 [hydrothermal vent metagenome]|uniref:Uncharacterized protein n=1 Tax=hydrothermal vent metagenome TaxID=652676 RepID=A0A3B0T0T8_9ZZZZ
MSIEKVILETLKSEHTERVVKSQMVILAEENLHKEGMADALATVLPLQNDTYIKKQILNMLLAIDISRLSKPTSFYKSLIKVLETEKEEQFRIGILDKFSDSIDQDERVIPIMLELLSGNALKDNELEIVLYAISEMPTIPSKTAAIVLRKAVKSTINAQGLALRIAESCSHWDKDIKQALQPYLSPTANKDIRTQIISMLQETKQLDESFIPILLNIVATDQDENVRLETLRSLSKFKPLRSDIIIQFVASSMNDSSELIRQKAVKLQNNISQLSTEIVLKLLAHLKLEPKNNVRITMLDLIGNYLKKPEVREAVLETYMNHSGAIEPEELTTYLDLLGPYMSRNEQITNVFLKDVTETPKIDNRKRIIKSLFKHCRTDGIINEIATVFEEETDDRLRKELFLKFKQLSLAKYPKLVSIFCQELQEPSSSFRLECATALEPNVLQFNEIPLAFEEILLYDQDKELIRLCLDGYLKPGVNQKFGPLLKVVENEFFDISSRQKVLDNLRAMNLSDKEQEVLKTVIDRVEKTGLFIE